MARSAHGKGRRLSSPAVETEAERCDAEERAKTILAFTPVAGVVAEETELLLAPFRLGVPRGRLEQGRGPPSMRRPRLLRRARRDGGLAFVRSSDVDLVPPDPRAPSSFRTPARRSGT
jgi:hypothetical protein